MDGKIPDWGWQGQGHTFRITDRAKYIIEHEAIPGDILFRVGPENAIEDIPGHKVLLAMGSSVFFAMFYGPAAELLTDCSVRIPDLDPVAFKNLVRFLYTEGTDALTWENVMGTLACAKKYGVPALLTACRYYAQEHICPENACFFLVQARNIEEDDLVQIALATIDRQTKEVFAADSFPEISHDLLCELLARDTLTANELDVYGAAHRWATEECKQHGEVTTERKREVLRDCIGLIRFPLLTPHEIADGPAQDSILTVYEENNLYRYFLASVKPKLTYSTIPRIPRPALLTIQLGLLRGSNRSADDTDEEHLGCIKITFHTDLVPNACEVIRKLCSDSSNDTIRIHWGPAPCVNELEYDGSYETSGHRPHSPIPVENFVLKHACAGMVSLETTSSSGDGRVDPARWWICTAPEPEKDGKNMVVGKVISGLELLDVAKSWMSRPDADGICIWIDSVAIKTDNGENAHETEGDDDDDDEEEDAEEEDDN